MSSTAGLAEGDMLPSCAVPVIRADFDQTSRARDSISPVDVDEFDLIVMTQSCDLENSKAPLVACCPICTLSEYEAVNKSFERIGEWERVRQGRIEGLHLLASPTNPQDKWAAYVVDFRSIYSLPVGYLNAHASQLPNRWRLRSPYLEHFSQAFARFFMRVGLPSSVASYLAEPKRPPALPRTGGN
ncbi:MAG: hypothetical protein ABSH22_00445 [Tepidisphaeraceae bacterium]